MMLPVVSGVVRVVGTRTVWYGLTISPVDRASRSSQSVEADGAVGSSGMTIQGMRRLGGENASEPSNATDAHRCGASA